MYAPRLLLFISGLELSYETAAQNHAVAGGVAIGAAAVDSGPVSATYLLVGESQSYVHSVYANAIRKTSAKKSQSKITAHLGALQPNLGSSEARHHCC